MADKVYWDCIKWRESRSGKAFPVRLGSALQRDDGGFQIFLDSYPTPDDRGQVTFVIQPQKGRYQGGQGQQSRPPADDDSIPF